MLFALVAALSWILSLKPCIAWLSVFAFCSIWWTAVTKVAAVTWSFNAVFWGSFKLVKASIACVAFALATCKLWSPFNAWSVVWTLVIACSTSVWFAFWPVCLLIMASASFTAVV